MKAQFTTQLPVDLIKEIREVSKKMSIPQTEIVQKALERELKIIKEESE